MQTAGIGTAYVYVVIMTAPWRSGDRTGQHIHTASLVKDCRLPTATRLKNICPTAFCFLIFTFYYSPLSYYVSSSAALTQVIFSAENSNCKRGLGRI
jgi:hypothetical protein